MKTMKKVIAVVAATFLLTSCGQNDGASVSGADLDFNAKVKVVELGIK
jgi:predicted small secreted protein